MKVRPNKNYTGVIVPMVTPFNGELKIDQGAVKRLLDTFLSSGVAPFILGTTGESVSIESSQKTVLVKTVTEYVNKKQKVYAGISGNCLAESIKEAEIYAGLGVDAVVAHLPFYYPVSPKQMIEYYKKLADIVPCKLFLYNNPITTNISIPIEVIEELSYHENIVGIKDSERGMDRLEKSIELWGNREDFVHLLGWAAQSAYALLNGSDGIVPSTANLTPNLYKELYNSAIMGSTDEAMRLQLMTNKISEIYQKDKNLSQSLPALKVMMSAYGLCQTYVMPPMIQMDSDEQDKIIKLTLNQLAEYNYIIE